MQECGFTETPKSTEHCVFKCWYKSGSALDSDLESTSSELHVEFCNKTAGLLIHSTHFFHLPFPVFSSLCSVGSPAFGEA